MNKIVIAGGSGFLGQVLANYFQTKANEIVILGRSPKPSTGNIRNVAWNGRDLAEWKNELNRCDVLINLTGKSVNCRYTEKNKKEILDSRLNSNRVLGEAIRHVENPPNLWIQAASSTIYRSSFDRPMDETTGEIGDDFSMNVCKQWEKSFWEQECPRTKKIVMRIAIVLGNGGGAVPPIINLVTFGLGGMQGNGKQMVSWIHEHDFARSVEWLIANGRDKGIYNCSGLEPVTNSEFMKRFRQHWNMPIGLPSPAWLLEIGSALIGTETELLLKSRWVWPKNLIDEGFTFTFGRLDGALGDIKLGIRK